MKKNTKRMLVTCAAAAFTMGTAMMSYAAYGWQQEDGQWHYYDKYGDRVTDEWKRSGNNWYWLDENGDMAAEYGIRNIPTVLFFKNGEVVDKQVGAVGKPVFVEKVKKLL